MLLVELGINCETVRELLHDKLHMQKLCAKLVPNALDRHVHLSRYANIWGEKYSHVATPILQPNLALCNFFLFIKLKLVLKGTGFDDLEEIKANTPPVLKALTLNDFKSCLKAWERRWNRCVISGGGEGYCVGIEV